VTSKNGGIGLCERNWGSVNENKTGKHKVLSGGLTEKQAIIYMPSLVKEARIIMEDATVDRETKVDFEDAALTFDKDLKSFGVVLAGLKRPPERLVFRAWMNNEEKK
jgi:hypothetical protein